MKHGTRGRQRHANEVQVTDDLKWEDCPPVVGELQGVVVEEVDEVRGGVVQGCGDRDVGEGGIEALVGVSSRSNDDYDHEKSKCLGQESVKGTTGFEMWRSMNNMLQDKEEVHLASMGSFGVVQRSSRFNFGGGGGCIR